MLLAVMAVTAAPVLPLLVLLLNSPAFAFPFASLYTNQVSIAAWQVSMYRAHVGLLCR